MSGKDNTKGTHSNNWLAGHWQKALLCVILLVSAVLLLANLGNQYLWQDEAQTALISKTILTAGVPKGYDGKNYFSQEAGAEYGKDYVWRWHTWLPFYVLAGFYKVFGVSTFVSRLPFVIFGFVTVWLLYYFARALRLEASTAAAAAGLLAISVPFLILSRQCRYYSMSMFFTLLALCMYNAMRDAKPYAWAGFLAASTLLFHTQHFYIGVLFAALALHAVIFDWRIIIRLIAAMFLVLLINVSWLIWLSGMNHASPFEGFQHLNIVFSSVGRFFTLVHQYVFSVWLCGALVAAAIIKRVKSGLLFRNTSVFWKNILPAVLFVFFNIASMSILSPVAYFRYIGPSVPILILLAAIIIRFAFRQNLLVGIACLALFITNSQIRDYLYEITHDYEGPEKGIAHYLNEHGSSDDIVAITYGDMGLKFYTKMRIVGGLTGEDLTPVKKARWVIIRKYVHLPLDAAVSDYFRKTVEWDKYRKIMIDYPDLPWENRESPEGHFFRTVKGVARVVIYERIN